MIEAVITTMIYLVVLAICVYIILWVLEIIGLALPPKVIQLLWVIVALVALLLIVRIILPHTGMRLGDLQCLKQVLWA